jgi:hypothetical protein
MPRRALQARTEGEPKDHPERRSVEVAGEHLTLLLQRGALDQPAEGASGDRAQEAAQHGYIPFVPTRPDRPFERGPTMLLPERSGRW